MMPEDNSFLVEYIKQDSSMIYLVIGKDGVIIYANAFAQLLSGRNLQGRPLNELFIDFGIAIDPAGFLDGSTDKKLINITTSAGLPETYYFRFYEQGDAIHALGEVNATELSVLRKNLLELNKEMNNLARELQKKNMELRKLNELKNQFLGIAAHDLRNPIGIIMGYSNFLLEELEVELSEDQVRMLKTIQETSEFMLHLLEGLLDISAIESGKLRLEFQKINLLSLVRKNVSLNIVIAGKKNIQIQVQSFENIPEIMADPSKMEQVMNNLLSNAIKYSMPHTTVKVTLFLTGDHITVSIADQGQGIPANEIENLFKPFQKISTKSTAGEKSTGLGLSIVRNIIVGQIWVESKVGVGSTFFFSLPLKM
jgi:signal transduction histidine kinase